MSIYWKKLEQYYLLDYNTPPHCVYVRVLFFLFFFSKSTEYSLHLQNKHKTLIVSYAYPMLYHSLWEASQK